MVRPALRISPLTACGGAAARRLRRFGARAIASRPACVDMSARNIALRSRWRSIREPEPYRRASIPLRLTTCSSFSAAPVGLRSPRSHWLTVFTATLR